MTPAAFNWFDWVLIAIPAFFMLGGVRRGFSRDIIGLVAALSALVLGMWFYGSAGEPLLRYTNSPRLANLIGFGIVVVGVLLCGNLLGWIVSRFLRAVGLSFFDRLLGAALGFVKGALIAVAVLTGFTAFGPDKNPAVLNSRIAPWVLEASRLAVAIAPMELRTAFRKQYDSVKSALTTPPERNEGKF